MKKLLLMLFIVVLLVGCAPVEEKPYEKPAAEVGEPYVKQTELPAEEIPEREEKEEAEGPSVLSDELKELIAKADNVASIDYAHSEFVKGGAGYYAHVYVKGSQMRQDIELGSGTYTKDTLYDTAYFNLAAGTVKAYCEADDCDDRNKVITEDMDKFVIETPFDVLDDINKGYKAGTAMVENRNTVIVEYEKGGDIIRVWLWDYKGIPLKYEVRDGEELLKKVEFQALVHNSVKDDQLAHKHLGEFD